LAGCFYVLLFIYFLILRAFPFPWTIKSVEKKIEKDIKRRLKLENY